MLLLSPWNTFFTLAARRGPRNKILGQVPITGGATMVRSIIAGGRGAPDGAVLEMRAGIEGEIAHTSTFPDRPVSQSDPK